MSDNILRNIALGIIGALLILYPALSFDYGVSGDEMLHVKQAKRIVNFYKTFGEDRRSITKYINKKMSDYDIPNIALYGNSPDTVAYIVQQTFLPWVNIYHIRHFLNAILGVIGIFFTALLAKELGGGWRTGLFAIGIFIVSPRFMGHTMNNLKDAPFAVAFVLAIYGMIRLLKELPKPSWQITIFLTASLAFALSIRVGALLLFVYFLMFLGLHFVNTYGLKGFTTRNGREMLKKFAFMGLGICVVGYLAGLILWPYGLTDPLTHPLTALQRQSDFSTTISQVFEGQRIMSENQPWYYLPKYMLITNPAIIFTGLLGLIALLYPLWKRLENKLYIGFVAFAAIFPLFYIIYGDSNVYNAWRHVLFVYPPLVALSGMGWDMLYRIAQSKKVVQYAVLLTFALMFLYPLQWMIRNHPHQVVFYNLPFGGVEAAYGKYELDYYMNGAKSAFDWIEEQGIFANKSEESIILASNIKTIGTYKDFYQAENTNFNYLKYRNRPQTKWNYAVFYTAFVDPYQLKQRIWPPEGTVHQVKVGGMPIFAVVKRLSFADYKGYQAFQSKQYSQAIRHFQNYLEKDPQNEAVLELTARAYNQMGNSQQAAKYFNKTLEIHPNSLSTLNRLGRIYMQSQNYEQAISIFQQMTNVRGNYAPAYLNLGYAYVQTGSLQTAISYLKKAVEINPRMKQAYELLSKIYQQQGNQQQAKKYRRYSNQLN